MEPSADTATRQSRVVKFRAWDYGARKMFDVGAIGLKGDGSLASIASADHSLYDEISPEEDYELMQFTGLYDKNGKEIYDGDVVEYYHPVAGRRRAEVFWYDEKLKFCKRIIGRKSCSGLRAPNRLQPNMVVVGNIYENPELLKEVV